MSCPESRKPLIWRVVHVTVRQHETRDLRVQRLASRVMTGTDHADGSRAPTLMEVVVEKASCPPDFGVPQDTQGFALLVVVEATSVLEEDDKGETVPDRAAVVAAQQRTVEGAGVQRLDCQQESVDQLTQAFACLDRVWNAHAVDGRWRMNPHSIQRTELRAARWKAWLTSPVARLASSNARRSF